MLRRTVFVNIRMRRCHYARFLPFDSESDVLCICERPIVLPYADVGESRVRRPWESWEIISEFSPDGFSGGFGVSIHIVDRVRW
jgi:hypothetical protein